MKTKELRNKVIHKVNEINDDNLLNDLIKILDNSTDTDEVFRLSENHKKAISSAIDQIEKGDYLTNEECNKKIDEWLKK